MENGIALSFKEERIIRNKPYTLAEIVKQLSSFVSMDKEKCKAELLKVFLWIDNINEEITNKNKGNKIKKSIYLPYKIHQFISQTDTVYLSLHKKEDRIITLQPALGVNKNGQMIPLFPVVFSRVSGNLFLCVTKDYKTQKLQPRGFKDIIPSDNEYEENLYNGYLIPEINVWKPEDVNFFPYTWLKKNSKGELKTDSYGIPVVEKKICRIYA